jgi:hypothetical protein
LKPGKPQAETYYEVTAAQMVLFRDGRQVIFAKPEPEQKYTGIEHQINLAKAKKGRANGRK